MNCRFVPVEERVRFRIKSSSTWLDSRFGKLRIQFLQIVSAKYRFDRAEIGTGANQRFVRALTQQKLQRANDD